MSKVVKRGAYRVKSTASGILASTFENPDGSLAAVVLNDSDERKQLVVKSPKGDFVVDIAAKSVTSISWK